LVPDPEQWDAIVNGRNLPREPRATLITDFYSYNTNLTADNSSLIDYPRGEQEGAWLQPHWVGDLSISAKLKVVSSVGVVRLELVEGGVVNRCEIDRAPGTARLSHGAQKLGEKTCPAKGPGEYQLIFANVDDCLTLVVDGRGVFGDGVKYNVAFEEHPAP